MRRRLMHGTIVIAVVLCAAVVGAGGAFAEGQGDPHAGEERGNPHVDDATGDPHVEAAADVEVTTETETAVEAAAAAAAAAPVVAAASAVTSSASAAATIAARPADGSVGNADDKTPPGQSANDKNKGHECDDNKGIGQGNPAHTGCTEEPNTPDDPDDPDNPDDVLGVQFSRTNAAVAGASLARTGGEQRSMATGALWLIVAGLTLVAISRRREATA